MIKTVYSVRDVKSGYGPLMLFDNDPIAMRSFTVSVRQTDSLMHWCAPDYALYAVARFDDETGSAEPFPAPVHVCDAVDVLDRGDGN